ncbi:WD40 repeat domain-containing protein, partial [Umezakia ovalisporum]|uniref:WD40 repeat domain-containing protein n=1 Tax=Umezakia ovalisporum TaxID=75695 RepID=UPI0039C70128
SDGQTLASGSSDNTIKIWQIAAFTTRSSSVQTNQSQQAAVSTPQNQPVTTPARPIFSQVSRSVLSEKTLSGHCDWVRSVAYSSDGQTLASGSVDKTIKIWNVNTGQLLQTLSGHSDSITSLAYSSDGQTLASGSSDNTIKIWQIAAFTTRSSSVQTNQSQQAAVSTPQNQPVTTPARPIFSQVSRSVLSEKTLSGHCDWVRSVAYSSDGQTLASGSVDKTIKIWNVNTGQLLQTL